MNKAENKIEYCELCNENHVQHNDGYGYLDCILFYRLNKEPKEIKEQRESKVEIWDIAKRVWVSKTEYYRE